MLLEAMHLFLVASFRLENQIQNQWSNDVQSVSFRSGWMARCPSRHRLCRSAALGTGSREPMTGTFDSPIFVFGDWQTNANSTVTHPYKLHGVLWYASKARTCQCQYASVLCAHVHISSKALRRAFGDFGVSIPNRKIIRLHVRQVF